MPDKARGDLLVMEAALHSVRERRRVQLRDGDLPWSRTYRVLKGTTHQFPNRLSVVQQVQAKRAVQAERAIGSAGINRL
jgi:hypothetical protein